MPRPRLDGWGQPLPELADARQAVQRETPHNQAMRRLLHALLEEQWTALLRRGVYAELTVSVQVRDGILGEEIDVLPLRHWRAPRDGAR